jgi:hypothetical protein
MLVESFYVLIAERTYLSHRELSRAIRIEIGCQSKQVILNQSFPSLRRASFFGAVLALIAVLAFDYANGWAR